MADSPAALCLPQALKPPRGPLHGRSEDLAALAALLNQHALVSVVAAGGMGKTRLARHLLARLAPRHADGACWIALAAQGDVVQAIAGAVGLPLSAGDPLAQLCAALAPLSLLIALDAAEHRLEATARTCQALLAAAPGLRIVVTSHVPLMLPLERLYRLGPLAAPQGPLPAARAQGFAAVALFAERAAQADPRFSLTDANAADVIALCRALDGQVLALELAAACLPEHGVAELAASLQQRLRLLIATRNRIAPAARQQTLRAIFDIGHALLAPQQAAVLRRLAGLTGHFDPTHAALADVPNLPAVLAALARRAMLALDSAPGEPLQYRLPDALRSIALALQPA
ncbi:hypothetical protein LRH25_07445 [Ideonella azotifigens]|uniref:NB-ARC domain-containing protein n=1 Tax=Ideonella azotifigens TaxID=513160 RepID=A0ABN1JQI2_9BURK|nr:hypothetical protein [Ideonella azotifigens]MCD2340175.1 hypothetical protein [Ideonella azotifigens]